jgi:hypothetical protein
MKGRRIWAIGGFGSGGLLVLFGIAALVLGISSYMLVHDELSREQIVGSDDMTPDAIAEEAQQAGLSEDIELPTCDVAGDHIDTGSEARCFASYMRIHALEATGGLTYAQMGRYQSASDPGSPEGTNDPNAAAKDENGQPISNAQRNTWVTETALATALNVSYMAEQTALFGIVVGVALLLTGIGLIILAYAVFMRSGKEAPPPAAA